LDSHEQVLRKKVNCIAFTEIEDTAEASPTPEFTYQIAEAFKCTESVLIVFEAGDPNF
jgi:hypothetical protein